MLNTTAQTIGTNRTILVVVTLTLVAVTSGAQEASTFLRQDGTLLKTFPHYIHVAGGPGAMTPTFMWTYSPSSTTPTWSVGVQQTSGSNSITVSSGAQIAVFDVGPSA